MSSHSLSTGRTGRSTAKRQIRNEAKENSKPGQLYRAGTKSEDSPDTAMCDGSNRPFLTVNVYVAHNLLSHFDGTCH